MLIFKWSDYCVCRHGKTEPCNFKLSSCFGVASPPPIDLGSWRQTISNVCNTIKKQNIPISSFSLSYSTHQRDGVERASVVPHYTASTTRSTGGATQIHCRLGFCKYLWNAVSKLSLHSTTWMGYTNTCSSRDVTGNQYSQRVITR